MHTGRNVEFTTSVRLAKKKLERGDAFKVAILAIDTGKYDEV